MSLCIRNGHILDPGHIDTIGDVWIREGCIQAIIPKSTPSPIETPHGTEPGDPVKLIDADGKIVTPGLIDLHVHFREPGQTQKETIDSGCRAAAAGGFTTVCTMPNTVPANDTPETTEFVLKKAANSIGVRVYPAAAITRGLAGGNLSDFEALKAAGAVAVTDDGFPVVDSGIMRRALETAGEVGLLVISHSEDSGLAKGGVMNEGPVARRLGLNGIPNAAESIMVMRDIALCELTRVPLHVAHVSTRESVRALREAKGRGVPVTAETAPHYFTLTDSAVAEKGADAKMNPPLRSPKDRDAIIQGLVDGTIDAIATDHAPHAPAEKAAGIMAAPNGIIGLETSLPLGLRLVQSGVLSLSRLIEKMSTAPAKILAIQKRLIPGAVADLTVIDPEVSFTVNTDAFQSKSRNCPFNGWQLKGRAVMTMVSGKIIYKDD